MTITTDFNVNDEVWVMDANKPKQGTINKIDIVIYDTEAYIITYIIDLHDNFVPHGYIRDLVFKTKKELLDSL